MSRARSYRQPSPFQIYDGTGRLHDIGEMKPDSDHCARPDPVANVIFWALLIGMGLGFWAAVIGFACAVLRGF